MFTGFIGVSLAFEFLFLDNNCTSFNKIADNRLPSGGAFLMLSNVPRRNITNLRIIDAYSDKTTVGIKISDSTDLLVLLAALSYTGSHYVILLYFGPY